MDLTVTQWEQVAPIIKKAMPAKLVSGRPRQDDQKILNGILWVCRTGAPWKDVPERYAPYQTCHRRFQQWVRQGVWEDVLLKLALDLRKRGKIDLSETYLDGSFAAAKKGALMWERLNGVRVPRSWQSQTEMVFLSPFPHMKQVPMKLTLLKKRYLAALSKDVSEE
jgi:transposase